MEELSFHIDCSIHLTKDFLFFDEIQECPKALTSLKYFASEVEFFADEEEIVIPIEIKSGSVTRAKSLEIFSQKYHPPFKVILSGKPFHVDLSKKVRYYPIYLASCIDRY